MKIISGNIIKLAEKGLFDAIVHGCNCEGQMGAGLAKQIREQYPMAYQMDLKYDLKPKKKLGTISGIQVNTGSNPKLNPFYIVNAYTQLTARGQGVLVDYDAIERAFATIKDNFSGYRIAYPKIGAGLARGDWDRIEDIIETQLDGEDHTLVLYQP